MRRLKKIQGAARGGSALLAVLIVIVLLALAAYTFAELMLTEAAAARRFELQVQARQAALSGVEYAAAVAGDPQTSTAARGDAPELFAARPVGSTADSQVAACFSVIAPQRGDDSVPAARFGLRDESAKLPLNALLEQARNERYFMDDPDLDAGDPRRLDPQARLLALPSMTVELADAILDWIDEDDDARPWGAEREDYQSLGMPYGPRNGPLVSLHELLLVRGVTPALVYGEDANRNGVLDPAENDGGAMLPHDDADGELDIGWADLLTVHAKERNIRSDGSPRIYVNRDELAALYDTVSEPLGDDAARFIAAFRMYGPADADAGRDQLADAGTSPVSLWQPTAAGPPPATDESGTVRRGGLELAGGHYEIASLYDLVDARVSAIVNGAPELLVSPWTTASLDSTWAEVSDCLTVSPDRALLGRIALSQAREETLLTVPGIDPQLARAILEATSATDAAAETQCPTTAWLVTRRLVPIAEMRQLDRYLATAGDVVAADIYGFVPGTAQAARLYAVIDATCRPARVVELTDLTELGTSGALRWLAPLELPPGG